MPQSSKHMIRAAGLAAALAFSAGAARAGNEIAVSYVVEMGGADIMKLSYQAEISSSAYASSLEAKSIGLTKMFSEYRIDLDVTGTARDGLFAPSEFGSNRKKKGKSKSSGLVWSENGEITLQGPDGPVEKPASVAAALSAKTSDPLTVILKIANAQESKPCSGKYRVYDGKDVADLMLSFRKNLVEATAASDGTLHAGLECRLTYIPVAGKDVEKGKDKPISYGLWLMPVEVPALHRVIYLPLRITGSSKGVGVEVSARSVVVDGKTVASTE